MTATSEEFSYIIYFITGKIALIFLALDSVYLYQSFSNNISILDVYIAIMLLELMFWYIIRVLTGKDTEDEGMSNTGVDSAGSSEVGINANEIDFSDEIVHE